MKSRHPSGRQKHIKLHFGQSGIYYCSRFCDNVQVVRKKFLELPYRYLPTESKAELFSFYK